MGCLTKRAIAEKWTEQRKQQRIKIGEKAAQKTADLLAEKEAERLLRISAAADELLCKLEEAIIQLDTCLAIDKRNYDQKVHDRRTGETIKVHVEEAAPKFVKTGQIDRDGLKQLSDTLKDLQKMQFMKKSDQITDVPVILYGEGEIIV